MTTVDVHVVQVLTRMGVRCLRHLHCLLGTVLPVEYILIISILETKLRGGLRTHGSDLRARVHVLLRTTTCSLLKRYKYCLEPLVHYRRELGVQLVCLKIIYRVLRLPEHFVELGGVHRSLTWPSSALAIKLKL